MDALIDMVPLADIEKACQNGIEAVRKVIDDFKEVNHVMSWKEQDDVLASGYYLFAASLKTLWLSYCQQHNAQVTDAKIVRTVYPELSQVAIIYEALSMIVDVASRKPNLDDEEFLPVLEGLYETFKKMDAVKNYEFSVVAPDNKLAIKEQYNRFFATVINDFTLLSSVRTTALYTK